MADDQTPIMANRMAQFVEGLVARFGARAGDIARTQRDQATGETCAVWAAIADRIAASPMPSDAVKR